LDVQNALRIREISECDIAARNHEDSDVHLLKTCCGRVCGASCNNYHYNDYMMSETEDTCRWHYCGSTEGSRDFSIRRSAYFFSQTEQGEPFQFVGMVMNVQMASPAYTKDNEGRIVACYILDIAKAPDAVGLLPAVDLSSVMCKNDLAPYGRGRSRCWTDALIRFFGVPAHEIPASLQCGIVLLHKERALETTRAANCEGVDEYEEEYPLIFQRTKRTRVE
jgi:hypothetical protein